MCGNPCTGHARHGCGACGGYPPEPAPEQLVAEQAS